MYNQHEHDALRALSDTYKNRVQKLDEFNASMSNKLPKPSAFHSGHSGKTPQEMKNPHKGARSIGDWAKGAADWATGDTWDFDKRGKTAKETRRMPDGTTQKTGVKGTYMPSNPKFTGVGAKTGHGKPGSGVTGKYMPSNPEFSGVGANKGKHDTYKAARDAAPKTDQSHSSITTPPRKPSGSTTSSTNQRTGGGSARTSGGGTAAKPKSQLTHGKFSNAEYDRLRKSGDFAAADKYGKQMHKAKFGKTNMSTDRAKPLTPKVPTPKPAPSIKTNQVGTGTTSTAKSGSSMKAAQRATTAAKPAAKPTPSLKTNSFNGFKGVELFEEEKKKGTFKKGREPRHKTKNFNVNVIAKGASGRTEVIKAVSRHEARQIAKSRFGKDRIGSVNTQPRQYQD